MEFESKQPGMEAHFFTKILERKVRKALKTEREEGEYQQKSERSFGYRRLSVCSVLAHRTGSF